MNKPWDLRTLVRSVPIAAQQIHSVHKTCSGKIAKLTKVFHGIGPWSNGSPKQIRECITARYQTEHQQINKQNNKMRKISSSRKLLMEFSNTIISILHKSCYWLIKYSVENSHYVTSDVLIHVYASIFLLQHKDVAGVIHLCYGALV
jgi:hypothetical protein